MYKTILLTTLLSVCRVSCMTGECGEIANVDEMIAVELSGQPDVLSATYQPSIVNIYYSCTQ